jgi:hypothetical protein
LKPLIDKLGTELNFLQVAPGGDPNTIIGVNTFESMADFAKISNEVVGNEEIQSAIAAFGTLNVASANVRLLEDIDAEIGGSPVQIDDPHFLMALQQRILPGKRDGFIHLLKQVREARLADGLPVSSVLETKIGEAGRVVRTRAFATLEDWAEATSEVQPAGVQEILDYAMKDSAYPYTEGVDSCLYANINNLL